MLFERFKIAVAVFSLGLGAAVAMESARGETAYESAILAEPMLEEVVFEEAVIDEAALTDTERGEAARAEAVVADSVRDGPILDGPALDGPFLDGGVRSGPEHAPSGSAHQGDRIVVGSKNFTESTVLAELMAQIVEEHTGLVVERRHELGGTSVCFEALFAGDIDLYPDYTGTCWATVLKRQERIVDPLRTFLEVETYLRREHDIELLPPFGLNNSYALALDAQRAEELGVETISQLEPYADQLEAAFSIEFNDRADGYPGLARHYGFEFGSARALEHGLAYAALAAGEIDLLDAYTTDGKLLDYDVRVLRDDKRFFPPYDAVPLVRGATLRAHPEIADALARLAWQVTNADAVRLNHEVESGRGTAREVTRAFLIERGLVGATDDERGLASERRGMLAFLASRWRETLRLTGEHLTLAGLAVLLAALIAIPLGLFIVRRRGLERVVLGVAGVIQTVPSLALLVLMIPLLGISFSAALLALFLYALLPILRNTVTGVRDVDPVLVDAARGIGLTDGQILRRVELPLATRSIMGGVRTSAVIGIGVATLAAFIGQGGLGEPIVRGLYLNDSRLILSGAVPAALLALLVDLVLGRFERVVVPRGLR